MTNKMTIEQALAYFKHRVSTKGQCGENTTQRHAFEMAIENLEKQIPKKVDNMKYVGGFNDRWIGKCPVCGKEVDANKTYKYCSCGQAIDWESDTE